MPRGRPPNPGTVEEKAAARREKVRLNVKALRERRKRAALEQPQEQDETATVPRRASLQSSSDVDDVSELDADSCTSESAPSSSSGNSSHTSVVGVTKKDAFTLARPQKVGFASQYTLALFGMFRTHFLPEPIHLPSIHRRPSAQILPDDEFVWTPCALWVTNAFTKVSHNSENSLGSTLLAIGLALNGVLHQDETMKAASLETYRKSLRELRGSLDLIANPSSSAKVDRDSLFLTCHAANMFELIQNSNLGATMSHIIGLGQLMLQLDDQGKDCGGTISSLLLQDYRTLEMPFAFKYRYAPKLSYKRRQSRSIPTNLGSDFSFETMELLQTKSMMIAITDTADDICLVMVRLDQLKSRIPAKEIYAEVGILLERLTLVLTVFDLWMSQIQIRYGPFEVKTSKALDIDEPIQFTTFELGTAYSFSMINQAYGIETCVDAIEYLISWESVLRHSVDGVSFNTDTLRDKPLGDDTIQGPDDLTSTLRYFRSKLRSTAICLSRSIAYFFDLDKGIIGQTMGLFPLETAKEMLNKEKTRLEEDLQQVHPQTAESVTKADVAAQTGIKNQIRVVERCLEHCKQMQIRAQQFGLPSVFDG